MVTPEQRALMAAAVAAGPRPTLGAIWTALEGVADPEVPIVSVIDLGMVRCVEWSATDPDTLVVRVTPTYTGCPATDVIMQAIRDALTAIGVAHLRLETQLAPPWTTGWLTPEARRKLREYGIAPAGAPPSGGAIPIAFTAAGRGEPSTAIVSCPRCGSACTERVAQFGSTPCMAQYRCTDCGEPFDYFKPF